MGIPMSLIAMALGYLVYVAAVKEKEGVKLLGQVIGIAVMIAGLLTAFCPSNHGGKCPFSSFGKKECRMSMSHSRHDCPMMVAKKGCPMKDMDDDDREENEAKA